MSNAVHNKYIHNLRGNKDVFLADIKHSTEFKEIEQRHLKNIFMGIYSLLGRVDGNDDSARKVHDCAAEVSDTFNIKTETAMQLLLTPEAPALYRMKYIPRVYCEGDEVVLRLHYKTTRKDLDAIWKLVKELQGDIGGTSGKKSIKPELAYCIHRQRVLKNRKMSEIYADYSHGRLEGYEGNIPTLSENDFRKYYQKIVKGL